MVVESTQVTPLHITPLRVAVFGYGLSAKVFHLPYLLNNPAFQVVGISTRQTEARELYPTLCIADTPEQLLAQVQPDLVVITTPNQLHAAHVELALTAGCHAVVEKPVCVDSRAAKMLEQLAKQQQKMVVPFFNRRWDDDFLAVQQLVRDQRLGRIRLFHSRYDRFRPQAQPRWKENAEFGSGVFWDLAPHLIDQMLQLFGKPNAVCADIRALREHSPCHDYFQLRFLYDSLTVELGSSPFQAGHTLRFDLQGEAGSARTFGFDPQEQQRRQPTSQPMARELHLASADLQQTLLLQPGNYAEFYRLVSQALTNVAGLDHAALPTLAQAIEGLLCMEAALQSSTQQSTVAIN